MNTIDLSGQWQYEIPGDSGTVSLPGTLDENRVGFPDPVEKQWHLEDAERIGLYRPGDPIVTRFTRRHTYEGAAVFRRELNWAVPAGKRIFLDCERARFLSLRVNGQEVPPCDPPSVSTPYVFELTGLMTGRDDLALISDNSYPGWPYDAIVNSSAASDETQTNWNGVLGCFRLRFEDPVYIQSVRVYPHRDTVDVCIVVDAAAPCSGDLRISSPALAAPERFPVDCPAGRSELWRRALPVRPDAARWDIEEGHLHPLMVSVTGLEPVTASFGLRDFRAEHGRLTLNGRNFFLRGEANCAVFPETGHPPMDVPAWRDILLTYRGYGVNCVRFHSHCPPEAAFTAADQLGMLLQPELSHWDCRHAFASPESRAYYRAELSRILHMLANHPSFVMLTLGNELLADESGHAFMDELLAFANDFDDTRLYANGSNTHYGELGSDGASGFYTSMAYFGESLRATSDGMRGWLNRNYPDLRTDYSAVVEKIREKTDQPVFSFEVGQYQVLPDFTELDSFHGVTEPANLRTFQARAEQKGLLPRWAEMVEASGELALLCYRAEVEAALRTGGYSGISLLGLQDFPGQGTALVGMLNSHLRPKSFPFARPERFRAFFRDVLPLALLPRLTYTRGETLTADIRLANYGKTELRGAPEWALEGNGFTRRGSLPPVCAPAGGLTSLGTLSIPLETGVDPVRLTLTVSLCGHSNAYSLWVYPDEAAVCPEGVCECRSLDEKARSVLAAGGRVYLSPPSTEEAFPNSVQGHFSTDFWSVECFPAQEGAMGQLIDREHPIFRRFPTDSHTDWQWWPMAGRRAFVLPENYRAIVTVLDSYAYLRPMAQLLECRCGGGRLLLSSLGLQDLQRYPEARALQAAIYRYLASDRFEPRQDIPPEVIDGLVRRNDFTM